MAPTAAEFRFAIGPVQAFVAQSRRTRDLWASSYLLSYLSGCAIDAIEQAGGKVLLPHADGDPLREAIRNHREKRPIRETPPIGSLPNQLTAVAADPFAAATAAEEAVRRAWRVIADVVWNQISEAAMAQGPGSRQIWERQIGSFLQIHWAVGGAEALARRKSWRGAYRRPEPGDKCTLMVGWQELSGRDRASERAKQDAFWAAIRGKLRSHDLREDERLCSLALVKRLFPRVSQNAIGWDLDTVHWPSTPYLAARPWAEMLWEKGSGDLREQALRFAEAVREAAPDRAAAEAGAARFEPADFSQAPTRFLNLGAGFLSLDDLQLPDRTELSDETRRPALLSQLEKLFDRVAIEGTGLRREPSRFYALLLLDGDRLGAAFGKSPDRKAMSLALGEFAAEATSKVAKSGGLTIYAGGDDLLAFLPVAKAVATASELADLYEKMLTPVAGGRATTSAALIFAHCRSPLRAVLEEAHHLLDQVAKEYNGRGSLATAVWKSTGVTVRWVTTWERPDMGNSTRASELLETMASDLAGDEISSSFVYGQRTALSRLAGADPWFPGLKLQMPEGIDAEPLVRAELARARGLDPEIAAPIAARLVGAMTPARRDPDSGAVLLETGKIVTDPLMLARFLLSENPEGKR